MLHIPDSRHLSLCRQKECTRRRIQWNKEKVYITSEWSSWEDHPELVWRSLSKRHHNGLRSLSRQATRNEFRKPSSRWAETRKGTRLTSRTNRPSRLSLRSLVCSITWYSPLATACMCTTSPPPI